MNTFKQIYWNQWLYTCLFGAVFGTLASKFMQEAWLHGLFNGALVGLFVAMAEPWLTSHFRQRSVIYQIMIMSLLWSGLIMLALTISHSIALQQDFLNWVYSLAALTHFIMCLFMATIMNVLLRLAHFLGPTTLKALLLGKYITPQVENRIFLFLDIADSTEITERIGAINAQNLISVFLYDTSHLIRVHGGEVQRYVGDQVMATWPLTTGVESIAYFLQAIDKKLQNNRHMYMKVFGELPRYRVGLHGGEVIAKEVGEQKRSVEFFGSPVNIASRLEKLAKDLQVTNIVSSDLIKTVKMPKGITTESLGKHNLAGLSQPMEVFTISSVENGAVL